MEQVNITYHGHACFTLEFAGYRTIIDPYRHGMVPGLPDLSLQAEAVYCSHTHDDHAFSEAVEIIDVEGLAPYTVEEFITPHDDQFGALRGWNVARIFCMGSLRVAHLGDIGCFPDDLLLERLKGVDCLLIPVGGTYTVDPSLAKRIVDAAQPRICIPMHYRTDRAGFDNIAHIDEFVKLFDAVNYADDSFILSADTEKQILVLNYNHN